MLNFGRACSHTLALIEDVQQKGSHLAQPLSAPPLGVQLQEPASTLIYDMTLNISFLPTNEAWGRTTATTKIELYSGIATVAPKSIVKRLGMAFFQCMSELQGKRHLLYLQRCEVGLPWASSGCAREGEQLPTNFPGSKAIISTGAKRTTTTMDMLLFMWSVYYKWILRSANYISSMWAALP